MIPFQKHIHPKDIDELISLTVENDPETKSMAEMQLEGTAALYNILCNSPFAYLADEVGMGKTYQALSLAAVVWNKKPGARILFISPRHNLQTKWLDDYRRFFASNYRRSQGIGDDRAVSVLFGEPIHRPMLFNNLRSWAPTIGMAERVASFIRHTSFTRPVYITSKDLEDLDLLWSNTRQKFLEWGLYDVSCPKALSQQNASTKLNIAFAKALNKKLKTEAGDSPYFELVIVDEAQCLRNPENQTNNVLFEILKGQVNKWLFMSATPAHGGPENIPTILNRYPNIGEVLNPDVVNDLPAMQKQLQNFMVRRQRKYSTKPAPKKVGKEEYRNHDLEAWAIPDNEMSTLGTLAMGIVQKGLVDILKGKNNRYRIGFLSSFESLQSSIGNALSHPFVTSEFSEDESSNDWHHDQAEGLTNEDAPDTNFIRFLTEDFEKNFNTPLPHPKIASVVDRVAPLAFGTESQEGGHKFLIFTRRVSTVSTLRDQLITRYLQSVETRVRRCWGVDLDWSGKDHHTEKAEETYDPEGFEVESDENPFRTAMSKKGWLFRYRQTFRASGRNTLFFEDSWLQRLCYAGGVSPSKAAQELPDELWAESWTHASRSAGERQGHFRADRLRYLAVHAIQRVPHIFGLDERSAAPWVSAYKAILHNHLEKAKANDTPHRAPELFSQSTLWTCWDDHYCDKELTLPAADPCKINSARGQDELYKRQVARTLLGQLFRLTDTLLDLYFADQSSQKTEESFPEIFIKWLSSEDPGAGQIRNDCSQWLKHLRLIVDSCLDGAGRSWKELAREESWPQLFNPMPVLGVTGSSGAHRTATRQFRTPSLPRVIVCTDTLKEGVDLHLFCDRVLHYGVAWTSGDLEQRVGRVDRFFSQIERRLNAEASPPDVQLHVGYPHIVASLERGQVERVIERQRRAERLMDSPLAGALEEDRDIIIGTNTPRAKDSQLEPYRPRLFPTERRNIIAISADKAQKKAKHYICWYQLLLKELRNQGWNVEQGNSLLERVTTIHGNGRQHELMWSFDAALGRYLLTLSESPWPIDESFSGGFRHRVIGRTRKKESFIRLLVPKPSEGLDTSVIKHFYKALCGKIPQTHLNAKSFWEEALASITDQEVEWLSAHKARVVVPRKDRSQTITLYAYEGGARIVGVVSKLENLNSRSCWGGAPSISGLRDWTLDTTNDLSFGYLDVHHRDELVFGAHVIHGNLSKDGRKRLLEEVAWRADVWEAELTGGDQW